MEIFRSERASRKQRYKSEINVVPYIDVMLVLLVIFMVCAPMINPGAIDLPSAGKTQLPPTSYIQISLKEDGSSEVGIYDGNRGHRNFRRASDRDALINEMQLIQAENPGLPVLIAAHKELPYKDVVRTIGDAKRAGAKRVALATQ